MDLESEAAQRVGTTLCNKWTLERLIGTGGMAAVYVANHKIGRREAIKVLHADVARDPELRERFEQEAKAVNRFKHPGAVDVRDIDVTEDGAPFMVMELLEGHPLSELARRPGGVEIGELLRMIDELLDVLAAAHAQSIIHRDIKPDNLFVLEDGRLKVLDFGIARVRGSVQTKLRTRVGATLGTAPYMPPEQIRGVEIDARADVFAVGATLFRLIARRRIHEAASEAETLVKMASAQAPPLASVAPETPRDVCLIVDRALMFNREQRYPDALTMQSDVRAVREGRPPPYASARLLESPPASVATGGAGGVAPGTAPTAHPSMPTMAASPVALHSVSASSASKPPASSEPITHDPATRPAMMVLGAAGLGAPLASTPAGAAAVNPALAAPSPPHESPPSQGHAPPGVDMRTLRSEQGFAAAVASVAPQGYVMATQLLPQVSAADAHAPGSRPDPRTQLSGAAPPPQPAPGESIPVVPAPAPTRRRRTLPGTEISVVPLILVGALFAAIGVGITLWFMLRDTSAPDAVAPTPTTPTTPAMTAEEPSIGPRATSHPSALPHPGPAHPGQQGAPGGLSTSPPVKGPVKPRGR